MQTGELVFSSDPVVAQQQKALYSHRMNTETAAAAAATVEATTTATATVVAGVQQPPPAFSGAAEDLEERKLREKLIRRRVQAQGFKIGRGSGGVGVGMGVVRPGGEVETARGREREEDKKEEGLALDRPMESDFGGGVPPPQPASQVLVEESVVKSTGEFQQETVTVTERSDESSMEISAEGSGLPSSVKKEREEEKPAVESVFPASPETRVVEPETGILGKGGEEEEEEEEVEGKRAIGGERGKAEDLEEGEMQDEASEEDEEEEEAVSVQEGDTKEKDSEAFKEKYVRGLFGCGSVALGKGAGFKACFVFVHSDQSSDEGEDQDQDDRVSAGHSKSGKSHSHKSRSRSPDSYKSSSKSKKKSHRHHDSDYSDYDRYAT